MDTNTQTASGKVRTASQRQIRDVVHAVIDGIPLDLSATVAQWISGNKGKAADQVKLLLQNIQKVDEGHLLEIALATRIPKATREKLIRDGWVVATSHSGIVVTKDHEVFNQPCFSGSELNLRDYLPQGRELAWNPVKVLVAGKDDPWQDRDQLFSSHNASAEKRYGPGVKLVVPTLAEAMLLMSGWPIDKIGYDSVTTITTAILNGKPVRVTSGPKYVCVPPGEKQGRLFFITTEPEDPETVLAVLVPVKDK